MKNTITKFTAYFFIILLILTSVSCKKEKSREDIKELTILIRMMDAQDQWFRNKIKEFETLKDIKITVAAFDRFIDIERMLKLDKESGKNSIALVKTPKEMLYPLQSKGYILPLKDAGAEDKDFEDYTKISLNVGKINGVYYYVPRKMETNTMLFLKSKVNAAVKNWKKFKEQINEMFKKENGYGLPDGFSLESDPDKWDWYDLAAVSYYWANTRQEDGLTAPRMAHRGKLYGGTMIEVANKIFQAGGKTKDLLLADTDPVIDMLEWEAFFRKNKLYNAGMWEQRWSGGGIWKAMQQGQVYLAFMHQIDAFFIHGVKENPAMEGYLVNSDDMAMAIMPEGVSLELYKGRPARKGGHYAQLVGWWWGIPKNSPSPLLSYELARWITSPEVHSEECATFGMMPVTKKVVNNLNTYFKEPWKKEVFKVATRQFKSGVFEIPTVTSWPSIEQKWLEIWDKITVQAQYSPKGERGKIDRNYIKQQIQAEVKEINKLSKQ